MADTMRKVRKGADKLADKLADGASRTKEGAGKLVEKLGDGAGVAREKAENAGKEIRVLIEALSDPLYSQLRSDAIDGKMEKESQKLLDNVPKYLDSLISEYKNNRHAEDIVDESKELRDKIVAKRGYAESIDAYVKDDQTLARLFDAIGLYQQGKLSTLDTEKELIEIMNEMVMRDHKSISAFKDIDSKLDDLTGKKAGRVYNLGGRMAKSPISGYKSTGAEEDRDKKIRETISEVRLHYTDTYVVATELKFVSDALREFQSLKSDENLKKQTGRKSVADALENITNKFSQFTEDPIGYRDVSSGSSGTGPAQQAPQTTTTAPAKKTKGKAVSKKWTEYAVEYIDMHGFAQDAIYKSQDRSLIGILDRLKAGDKVRKAGDKVRYDEALSVWKAVMLSWNAEQSEELRRFLPSANEISNATAENAHILHRRALHAQITSMPEDTAKKMLSATSFKFITRHKPMEAPEAYYAQNNSVWNKIHYDEMWPNFKLTSQLRGRKAPKGELPPAAPETTEEVEEAEAPPLAQPF